MQTYEDKSLSQNHVFILVSQILQFLEFYLQFYDIPLN